MAYRSKYKSKIDRRNFLKGLAVAPIAAKAIAEETLSEEIAEQTAEWVDEGLVLTKGDEDSYAITSMGALSAGAMATVAPRRSMGKWKDG